jgi:hypothetical protein
LVFFSPFDNFYFYRGGAGSNAHVAGRRLQRRTPKFLAMPSRHRFASDSPTLSLSLSRNRTLLQQEQEQDDDDHHHHRLLLFFLRRRRRRRSSWYLLLLGCSSSSGSSLP